MKIVTVAGSRAEAEAVSQVSRRIRESHEEVFVFCPPVDDLPAEALWGDGLGLARPRHQWVVRAETPARRAADLMVRLERVVRRERPDVVLVQGGGEAAMAGAVVAAQLHFASAHLEAGLRAPQVCAQDDVHRRVADRLASFRFCATAAGAETLQREGLGDGVHVVGDAAWDALETAQAQAPERAATLQELGLAEGGYYLAVVWLPEREHGAEKLAAWLTALEGLSLPVALLLHPRARLVMHEREITLPTGVDVLKPLGLSEMLVVEAGAKAIVTDAPAVQREAIFVGTACVAVGEPAWPEAGGARGAAPAEMAAALEAVPGPEGDNQPFGDGRASERVVEILSGGTTPAEPQETQD